MYHRHSNKDDSVHQPKVGDVVMVHDDTCSRGFCKLAKIEGLLKGADELVGKQQYRYHPRDQGKCPLICLYPLEVKCQVKTT